MPVIAFAIFSFLLVFLLYAFATAAEPKSEPQDNDRVRERLESIVPRSMAS